MLNVDTDTLSNLISKGSRGRFGISKASEIQESAKNTFGVNFSKEAFAFQIKQIIAQIDFIEEQLKELEIKISILLHQTNSVITTITGVGDVLGAVIIGEIGDIARFKSAPKLVAYAGLDPSVNQSGDFAGTKNKISKRGSPYLRRAIWLAANTAAFRDSSLSVYYQSLKAREKHHLTLLELLPEKCAILFLLFSVITGHMCLILNSIAKKAYILYPKFFLVFRVICYDQIYIGSVPSFVKRPFTLTDFYEIL